jgi:hypothetical protein
MPFAEWLYRMSEDKLPTAARVLAIYAATFNAAGNDALARLAGMDLQGRADKTFASWRNLLVAEGWLIIKSLGKGHGRGPRVQFAPAYRHLPVELVEVPDGCMSTIPMSGPRRKSKARRHCSTELREKVRAAFDFTCQRCGFRCAPGEVTNHKGRIVDVSFLTVDRILPGSKGGQYTEDNVTLACRDCNSRRRDKLEPVGASLAMRDGLPL